MSTRCINMWNIAIYQGIYYCGDIAYLHIDNNIWQVTLLCHTKKIKNDQDWQLHVPQDWWVSTDEQRRNTHHVRLFINRRIHIKYDINSWSIFRKPKSGSRRSTDGLTDDIAGKSLGLQYSGPWNLRPPIQPAKYGLKLKVVLKERDIYTENIQVVLLISGLKLQGIVK